MGVRWIGGFAGLPTVSVTNATSFSSGGYNGYYWYVNGTITVKGADLVGVEIALVGGGGSGGSGLSAQIAGGGGGGAELIMKSGVDAFSVVPSIYSIVVGSWQAEDEVYAYSSTGFGYTARGGQNGAKYLVQSGISSLWRGGTGGKDGSQTYNGGAPTAWTKDITDGTGQSVAGGGGAGYAGNGTDGASGGAGGGGTTISWTGTTINVCGGGGGGNINVGAGANASGRGAGGGGAGKNNWSGNSGTKGIVIVRWPAADNPHTAV
jgi:hypothetical protein